MDSRDMDLESRLSEAGRTWRAPAPGPDPAFLGAVRRRRTARRVRAGALGMLVVAMVAGSAWLVRSGTDRRSTGPRIVEGPAPRTGGAAPGPGSARSSMWQMTAMNRGAGPDQLVLPEAARSRVQRVMRLLDSRDPAFLDAGANGA